MRKHLLLPVLFLLISSANAFAQCTAEILQTGPLGACQQSVMVLTATPGGVSYQWMLNGVPIAGANADAYVVPTVNTGTFTYTVDIDFGTCTDVSDPLDLTVCPTPSITASSNAPLCVGQTLQLSASFVPSATYQWVGPQFFNAATQNPTVSNMPITGAGVYTVTATQTNVVNGTPYSCSSQPATTTVPINPIPAAPAFTSNSPVCVGGNIEFAASGVFMGIYSITGPNAFVSNTQNPIIYNAQPTDAGQYMVTVTVNGCPSAPETTTVVINPTPNIAFISYIDPTYPNTSDGSITISGLVPYMAYVVNYTKNSVPYVFVVNTNGAGSIIMTSLGEGTYDDITVTLNGCTSNAMGPYVLVAQTPFPDYVWPGDVNYDHYANNDDVLDLGLAYGQTGVVRSFASINWTPQGCTDWGTL